MFMPGDLVRYKGSKFKDILNKVGEVVTKVKGSAETYVVDFADSYVMSANVLTRFKPSKEPGSKEPEVQIRKRRREEDEE